MTEVTIYHKEEAKRLVAEKDVTLGLSGTALCTLHPPGRSSPVRLVCRYTRCIDERTEVWMGRRVPPARKWQSRDLNHLSVSRASASCSAHPAAPRLLALR